jgi:hypothetical protein
MTDGRIGKRTIIGRTAFGIDLLPQDRREELERKMSTQKFGILNLPISAFENLSSDV